MGSMEIANRISSARMKHGMSKSELARRVDVTPTCVWNWERGNTRPRPSAVAKICEVLGLDETFLFIGGDVDAFQFTAASPRKVDEILDDASAELAETLGVTKDRIKIRFEVLQNA
jgi:transcriptional regulator with XRE-family HTH domain